MDSETVTLSLSDLPDDVLHEIFAFYGSLIDRLNGISGVSHRFYSITCTLPIDWKDTSLSLGVKDPKSLFQQRHDFRKMLITLKQTSYGIIQSENPIPDFFFTPRLIFYWLLPILIGIAVVILFLGPFFGGDDPPEWVVSFTGVVVTLVICYVPVSILAVLIYWLFHSSRKYLKGRRRRSMKQHTKESEDSDSPLDFNKYCAEAISIVERREGKKVTYGYSFPGETAIHDTTISRYDFSSTARQLCHNYETSTYSELMETPGLCVVAALLYVVGKVLMRLERWQTKRYNDFLLKSMPVVDWERIKVIMESILRDRRNQQMET